MNLALYSAKELPHLLAGTWGTEQANALRLPETLARQIFPSGETLGRSNAPIKRRSKKPRPAIADEHACLSRTDHTINNIFRAGGQMGKHYACTELLSADYPNLDAPLFWIC